MNSNQGQGKGAQAGPGALAGHLGAGVLRLGVGLASGSLALLADAMGSAAAAFSLLMDLFARRLPDPSPDRDHPYGHHKHQALAALAIAALLLLAAFEILQGAVLRLGAPAAVPRLGVGGVLVLLVALGLQVAAAGAESPPARWWRGLPSLAALLGVMAADRLRLPWLDPLLAVPLALLLLAGCRRVLRDRLPLLVDRIAIAPEAIHAVAMGVPGVLNCHDIASRGIVGQQVFIDMHMVVEANDLPTAHRITELVEERLEARYGPLRCTIHLEPREYATAAITFRGIHG